MRISIIDNDDKMNFIELLLLADEEMSMIEKYLYRGEMFALYDEDLKSICVVTDERDGNYELKNIATKPECQKMGYGKRLVSFISDYYRNAGKVMFVGTGDTPEIVRFYSSCGFVYSHTVKNFFVDNYPHPIIENGKRLTDMIYFKKLLLKGSADS